MYGDAVVDVREGGPPSNDACRGDGVERAFLPLPEQAAALGFRLDGLGGGTSRLAKRRSVDTEMTCITRVRGGRVGATSKYLGGGEIHNMQSGGIRT